ncbi:hypothetical protein [Pseudoalteromonas umbrosa]|uniref:hypothetical protein n=1 Tax=Pseudoalteromonas umbrosa TaxID=3048489 RepID=UPI0024C3E1FA|nr:hypothetical protein [Pseudoalteromonas sp. B95]MDK1290248.1 hypothetical protein [Pseudoalteromonas sp. B95]
MSIDNNPPVMRFRRAINTLEEKTIRVYFPQELSFTKLCTRAKQHGFSLESTLVRLTTGFMVEDDHTVVLYFGTHHCNVSQKKAQQALEGAITRVYQVSLQDIG